MPQLLLRIIDVQTTSTTNISIQAPPSLPIGMTKINTNFGKVAQSCSIAISKGGLWLWRLCPRAARRKLGSRGHSETRSSQMHWSSSGSSRSRNLRSNSVCRFANVTTCITKRKYGGFLKYGYPLNHWWNPLIIRNNSLDDFGVNPHIHWRFPHGEAQRWCRQWKGHWGDTQLENHGKSGGNKVQAVGNWQCR